MFLIAQCSNNRWIKAALLTNAVRTRYC